MTKLEQLINVFCPNGVEYKRLRDIATISRGGSFQKKDFTEHGIPCIHYGQIYTRYGLSADKTITYIDEAAGEKAKFAEPNDIVMAVTSENVNDVCKCVAWIGNEKVAVSGHTAIIHHNQNAKYLSYYFNSEYFYKQKVKLAHGTKVIEVTPDRLGDVKLPVPPLEVQCEIVHILNSFTSLTAELTAGLTAEFTARKKQYDFYRDKLLDFKEGGVQRIPMRNLFDFRNGLSKGKEFFGKGTPFIRYTDVYNHRFLHKEDITERVTCTEKEIEKLSVKRGDILFTRTSETAEEVGYSSVMLDNIGECVFNGFTIRATPKTDLLMPEYCAYCFSTNDFRDYVATHCAFTTRASLTGTAIGEYQLAVPSMEIQKRLVYVLEHFETICNNLNIGILAEIEARQKQYEFYRDKLLNFKELSK